MSELQEFLRKNGLDQLVEKYAIGVSRGTKYPNLVNLSYNQIESPLDNIVVQQCRGIILDENDDWNIISYPYHKFFNYNEPLAADIDWASACVMEKLDGSLLQLYWYKDQWHCATSGTVDAECRVHCSGLTFKDLFWNIFNKLGYRLPESTNHCFMFELCGPVNKNVVRYNDNRLVLHGVRNLRTFQEEHPESHASVNNWDVIQKHDVQSLDAAVVLANSRNAFEFEGFVVRDNNFNRVKIKSLDYIKYHSIKSSTSVWSLLDVVVKNETSEFLSYFPEFADICSKITDRIVSVVDEYNNAYFLCKDIKLQKDFAMFAKQYKHSSLLFELRKGVEVRDHLARLVLSQRWDTVGRILDIKNI